MKFSENLSVFHKILSGNKNLAQIKGQNTRTNVLKIMCNNPNLELINICIYIKFGENQSVCSQDIEPIQNFGINQGS